VAQDSTRQNLQNHIRFFPLFHFFVLPVLVFNVIRAIAAAVREFTFATGFGVVLAIALLALAFAARLMALSVQDRVIRLEMRLRLAQVLPVDLRPRIGEFTHGQLCALRFASDAELPALARKVLDEKLESRKGIKQLVKDWQPDYLRA